MSETIKRIRYISSLTGNVRGSSCEAEKALEILRSPELSKRPGFKRIALKTRAQELTRQNPPRESAPWSVPPHSKHG